MLALWRWTWSIDTKPQAAQTPSSSSFSKLRIFLEFIEASKEKDGVNPLCRYRTHRLLQRLEVFKRSDRRKCKSPKSAPPRLSVCQGQVSVQAWRGSIGIASSRAMVQHSLNFLEEDVCLCQLDACVINRVEVPDQEASSSLPLPLPASRPKL